jgi:diadenosine tetraphosphatase ApaH/serine/threonine PP2A family protein phosphatase
MFDPDGFSPIVERANFWTRQELESDGRQRGEKRWEFLASRPRSFFAGSWQFVHASPRNPLHEYVFPEDIYNHRKMERIFALVTGCSFQGHTHIPGFFVEGGRSEPYWFHAPEEFDGTYHLDARKTMVNVGSVGQPRDGDWRACYVILEGKTITFHRVEYDVERTILKIRDNPELDNFFGDRLRDGR